MAPKGLSKSRRVTGRVLARNDRAALDLTRRPPRKGDVVHCLHYNPDGSYDDWFAGSVKRVEDHNKITIKFDDGSARLCGARELRTRVFYLRQGRE